MCEDDEICVDVANTEKIPLYTTATCVKKSDFIEAVHTDHKVIALGLGGKNVSMVLSGKDGTTVMEAARMEVDADASGSSSPTDKVHQWVIEGQCESCSEVRTQALPLDTKHLTTKAELVATVAAVGFHFAAG